MRSQLDCVDRRLPGTGVFDIKTRACLPIRMDILNFEVGDFHILSSSPAQPIIGKLRIPYPLTTWTHGEL